MYSNRCHFNEFFIKVAPSCENIECFGGCQDGVCEPCPAGYVGDGENCEDLGSKIKEEHDF